MCGNRWPFTIEATVLLPDHFHTIWTLPDEDADFSRRWAFVKKEFTKAWLASGGGEGPTTDSDRATRRRGVWQRRFWEHAIQTERDFLRHCDYIHYNPVRHDLVRCPHEWPYSTFPRWVARGAYARDWLCSCNNRTVTPLDLPRMEATTGE